MQNILINEQKNKIAEHFELRRSARLRLILPVWETTWFSADVTPPLAHLRYVTSSNLFFSFPLFHIRGFLTVSSNLILSDANYCDSNCPRLDEFP